MMNNNGKPLSRKQTVRLLVALTILAWATQTLLHQWGYSQEIPTTQPQSTERFVPAGPLSGIGATRGGLSAEQRGRAIGHRPAKAQPGDSDWKFAPDSGRGTIRSRPAGAPGSGTAERRMAV